MVCSKCNSGFTKSNPAAICAVCKCKFHTSCCRLRSVTGWSGMSPEEQSSWRCDGCSGVSPKSDTEDSPLIMGVLQSIQRELSDTRKENSVNFAALETKMTSVQTSVDDLRAKLLEVETENVKIKREVNDLQLTNMELKHKVCVLEGEIHELQQYSRNRNLEVKGVPVTRGEDVYRVLEAVAAALGVVYNRHDISVAHRVKGKFSNIVVQFISRSTRALWLEAARRKRIQTTDLNASLRPGPVFVNEHLTTHFKDVLGRAKQLVRERKLAFAWSRDGKVLVRREADGKATQVFSIADVNDAALPPTTSSPRLATGVRGVLQDTAS